MPNDVTSQDNVVDVEDDALDLEEDEDTEDEDTSFGVNLDKTGQPGGFHTSNPLDDQYQRLTVTERRGPVDIRCKSRVVIHGYFDTQSDDVFATLLVYDFFFDATKRFRRIASANITFEFSSSEPGAPAPEVDGIAPFGRYSLLQTQQKEHTQREAGANAGGGYMGAKLGASYKWSNSVDSTTTDDTRLVGATVCDKYGREIGANWTLHENATTRKGVPSFLRTAILLKRKRDEKFQCTVRIDVEADWMTELTPFTGLKDIDDPVLFDPALPPTNKLGEKYDDENLSSTKLEDIFDTTFHTTFRNPIKGDGHGRKGKA